MSKRVRGTDAARELGVDRSTVYKWLKRRTDAQRDDRGYFIITPAVMDQLRAVAADPPRPGRPRTRPPRVPREPGAPPGGAHNATKTHCPAGHAYVEHGITYPSEPRRRRCRICHTANAIASAQRRRERDAVE